MHPGRQVVERCPRRLGAGVELARAHRLQERFRERASDAHRLAHRLHLRPQLLVGARELLEREPGELDDHVVERRLEARRRGLRQVVRDLVERVADGELRRHLGDRVAGGLARERRGAGDARVHLDHAQLAGLALTRELDVGAAGLDPDCADHAGGGVAELLEGLVREGHLRRHGDRVAGVDAHRVEVLDRADDHHVVPRVPHHLELELVPADQRLLDQDLAHGALGEGPLELPLELLRRSRDAAAVTPERERGAQDQREGEGLGQFLGRGHDDRLGHPQPDALHRLAEERAVLGATDGAVARPDRARCRARRAPRLRRAAVPGSAPSARRGSAAARRAAPARARRRRPRRPAARGRCGRRTRGRS